MWRSCRSRKTLQNDYLVAKIAVDAAENEPIWTDLSNHSTEKTPDAWRAALVVVSLRFFRSLQDILEVREDSDVALRLDGPFRSESHSASSPQHSIKANKNDLVRLRLHWRRFCCSFLRVDFSGAHFSLSIALPKSVHLENNYFSSLRIQTLFQSTNGPTLKEKSTRITNFRTARKHFKALNWKWLNLSWKFGKQQNKPFQHLQDD